MESATDDALSIVVVLSFLSYPFLWRLPNNRRKWPRKKFFFDRSGNFFENIVVVTKTKQNPYLQNGNEMKRQQKNYFNVIFSMKNGERCLKSYLCFKFKWRQYLSTLCLF